MKLFSPGRIKYIILRRLHASVSRIVKSPVPESGIQYGCDPDKPDNLLLLPVVAAPLQTSDVRRRLHSMSDLSRNGLRSVDGPFDGRQTDRQADRRTSDT